MAIGTNLPPQAYTRETLTQAFAWLQTQPESVRRIATTPESLVSLYSRNQRFGPASQQEARQTFQAPISPLAGDTDLDDLSLSEAPVSAQNFKTDLKTLAEGLKQFEDPKSSRASSPQQVFHQVSHPVSQHVPQQVQHPALQQAQPPTPQPVQQQLRAPAAAALSQQNSLQGLTVAAQEMIREVKNSLNLSSEQEAINMMVSIAYKNIKTLLA